MPTQIKGVEGRVHFEYFRVEGEGRANIHRHSIWLPISACYLPTCLRSKIMIRILHSDSTHTPPEIYLRNSTYVHTQKKCIINNNIKIGSTEALAFILLFSIIPIAVSSAKRQAINVQSADSCHLSISKIKFAKFSLHKIVFCTKLARKRL